MLKLISSADSWIHTHFFLRKKIKLVSNHGEEMGTYGEFGYPYFGFYDAQNEVFPETIPAMILKKSFVFWSKKT